MTGRTRRIAVAHLAWLAVGLFWFLATRDFHPTSGLAVIVTVSLVAAFAVAADVNHFLLIPRFWQPRRFGAYFLVLLVAMAGLTGLALTVIRLAYFHLHGPDADPDGVYKHFAIDLFGVAVHVALAAGVVWGWRRSVRGRSHP